MHIRYIGSAIAALAALSPSISNALPDKTSLDACVAAFEKSLPDQAASNRAYKVVFNGDHGSGSVAQYFTSSYTYDLAANDVNGAVFARARCSTNKSGVVTSLSPLPLATAPQDPALTARD
ncbi:MAG: hypothetical protein ABSG29_02410 [Steroidobacteraceae bacterium]|jgi:hypothetical protein